MKSYLLTEPYSIVENDLPVPDVTDNEVILKVNYMGICGSDIQMYHGLHKYMTYPVVIGHEVSAYVEKVGANVTEFKQGDLVTVEPQHVCGECYPCKIGRFNVCENLKVKGVHEDGMACEYYAIDKSYLHLCTGLDEKTATLMEPLAVGVGSAKRAGNLSGKNVCVVGAGTIGNLVAQSAVALGAGDVMVTDFNQMKLDYAKECGIPHCINTADITLKEAIENGFGIQKADVIIDCAATKGSMDSIIAAARPASSIVVTGNFKAPYEMEVPMIQRQEINFLGHMMYVREDFADAIRFAKEGKVKLDGFITKIFDKSHMKEAFEYIDDHTDEVMKVIISFNDK